MQHVVDCKFNNFAALLPTSSISAVHMHPNGAICSQACLGAMCKETPGPDPAARHRPTNLAYKPADARHVIQSQGRRHGLCSLV